MHSYHEIIKAPVVTEKTNELAQAGKYVFSVAVGANKTYVKQAIEALFKVKVEKVNIRNVKPKLKGRRQKNGKVYKGLTNRERKAIVTLKPGQTIDFN